MSYSPKEEESDQSEVEFKPYKGKIKEDTLIKDKYYVIEKLGDGCYAKVYLVQDINTDEVYALKAINKIHFKSNKKLRFMLDKEAKIHRQMNHPNVVKLNDYFEDQNYVFFLLEYVFPGEIFPILYKEKGFSERKAANYVYQVVQALKYCKDKNVLHRDLKPENLLLNEKGTIKLADFGWATYGHGSSVVGSVHYNSPEMLRYKRYDHRSDIWSLGVLIYELLCCEQPFRGEGRDSKEKEKETERLIKRGKIHYSRYTRHLSPEALDLIETILMLDPEQRPTYDEILAHPWFQINLPDENEKTSSRGLSSRRSSRSRSVERSFSRKSDDD